jgi:hypothetical protein
VAKKVKAPAPRPPAESDDDDDNDEIVVVEPKKKQKGKPLKAEGKGKKRKLLDQSAEEDDDKEDDDERRKKKNADDDEWGSDSEDDADLPPKSLLWMLTKPKYIQMFKMCQKCSTNLFEDKNKFSVKGDRVRVSIVLCKECVHTNMSATELLAPSSKSGGWSNGNKGRKFAGGFNGGGGNSNKWSKGRKGKKYDW